MKKINTMAACLLNIIFSIYFGVTFAMDDRQDQEQPTKRRKLDSEEIFPMGNTLDIQKVGEYFLMKDKERIQQGISGEMMDRWKLQKLCYYAQGYYLSLYDIPLFAEEMVAYHDGPFNGGPLSLCYYQHPDKGYPYLDWPREINKNSYTNEQMLFLNAIFEQKRMLTGKQLRDATHLEDPWCKTVQKKGVRKRSVIDKDLMKTYFGKKLNLDMNFENILSMRSEHQARFVNLTLFFSRKEKVKEFICQLKVQSKYLQSEVQIAQFGDFLTKLSEHEELGSKLEGSHDDPFSFQVQRWPHQTFSQALAGYLMFPQELEDLSDPVHSIYGRKHVHIKLAYSAKFGNTLAFYHLEELLKTHNSSDEDEEDDKVSQSALTEIQNYFHQRFEKLFFPQNVMESQTPFYSTGLILSLLDNPEEGRKYYERAAEQKDGRAIYQLAIHEDDPSKKEEYCKQAEEAGYIKIITHMAETMSPEDALEKYVEAGKKGVAEGFYQAAKLFINGLLKAENENQIFDYLNNAGELGMLTAYDLAAELYINEGLTQKAYDCFEKEGKAGNSEGFYKLAQAYENTGGIKAAKKYYKKSGQLSGYFDAARLEKDERKAKKIEKEAEEYYIEHFQELKDIVEGEEK